MTRFENGSIGHLDYMICFSKLSDIHSFSSFQKYNIRTKACLGSSRELRLLCLKNEKEEEQGSIQYI